jgi:HipA-like protein
MSNHREVIDIYIDSSSINVQQKIGILSKSIAAGKTVFSFEYKEAWLQSANTFSIDPSLLLISGEQFSTNLPRIFSDISPDRWGRSLLEKRCS